MSSKTITAIVAALLAGCHRADESPGTAPAAPAYLRSLALLRANTGVLPPAPDRVELFAMYNREAPVPPQCYTRTDGKHNPCYVCHQNALPGRENTMNDGELQATYRFSAIGSTNHWTNLFTDRSKRVAAISDAEILQWIGQDNYSELAPRLRAANFQGWIPDLKDLQQGAAAFDENGFARDGSHWVAFNYKPFPSTFWPTNGATDDTMIRLPAEFRSDTAGRYSAAVYRANLAVLEANIKGVDRIDTLPIDENNIGIDLDGDGKLGIAHSLHKPAAYFGAAHALAVVPFIYPQGTEFLHTVRYIGVDKNGGIYNAPRLKEVRYMRRWLQSDHAQLKLWYAAENAEKRQGRIARLSQYGAFGTRYADGLAGEWLY